MMRRALRATLAALFVMTIALRAQDDDPTKAKAEFARYFPLQKGWKWTYQATGKDTFVMEVTSDSDKFGEQLTDVSKVETKKGDEVLVHEHYKFKEDGLHRIAFQGQEAEPSVNLLKSPLPKEGESWKVETKVADQPITGTYTYEGLEKIKVPAGEYEAVKIASSAVDIDGRNVKTTYYFVKDVGIAKWVINISGREIVIELTKVEKPQ